MIMNIKKIVGILFTCFCVEIVNACPINFNDDWSFQKIKGESVKKDIKNQGVEWSSQYNPEIVVSGGSNLTVAEEVLKSELSSLRQDLWEPVHLPHTPNVEELVVLHQWQGVCYYKKNFSLAENELGKQIWIEFKGAMHLADVWINGKHIQQHAGGYTPFVVDLTGITKKENEILVRLENRDNPLIPPGKPVSSLDFCYYGGLYRGVTLFIKEDLHITHPILANKIAGGGVFVTYPQVSRNEAIVEIKTDIRNNGSVSKNFILLQTLYELEKNGKRGRKIESLSDDNQLKNDSSKEVVQQMKIMNPRLWSPDSPNRYLLVTDIVCNGKLIDSHETRIGIRHIEMTRQNGFVLNGKPIRLVGSNRHMEYPYVGNAISDNAQYRDIYQIKMNGFNTVRLGHYPQDPSVLEACDELGLLAIEPIPGWQFFNKNPLFIALTYRDIRDMIRRDRNHPSVIMWETTLNESWPSADWKNEAVRIAKEEYPGNQMYTSGDLYGYDGFDISYNDWKEGFNRPNDSKNPGFIREYYDYEFGGHFSTTRIIRGDGEKALIQNAWNAQWSHNRYRSYYPWTIGDAVWSMYDYNRGCCDNICYSGVADVFRLPKYSLHFFRHQIAEGTPLPGGKMPYSLFIANQWTSRSAKQDTVIVYGNVDEVELVLNGRSISRKKADQGDDSDYVTAPDGGNCNNLNFPPFTFLGIKWASGTLEAVGYKNGKRVHSEQVHTPLLKGKLEISYFESGKKASRQDVLIIYVSLKDKNGTIIPVNDLVVNLNATGGEVIGKSVTSLEAGIACFIVKTSNDKKLTLKATADNMHASQTIVLID